MLLLIFILGTVISGAISAVGAIDHTNTNLRRQMRPLVTIEVDQDAVTAAWEADGGYIYEGTEPGFHHFEMRGEWPTVEPIMPEMIREIEALPQVEHGVYSIHAFLPLLGVREHQVITGGEWGGGQPGEVRSCAFSATGECIPETVVPILQGGLRGISGHEPVTMSEGLIELVEGSNFENYRTHMQTDAAPVMISRGLAIENGWELESIIRSEQRWWVHNADEIAMLGDFNVDLFLEDLIFATVQTEFEIIGLFDVPLDEALFEQNEIYEMQRIQHLTNHVYTTNEAAEAQILAAREVDREYELAAGLEPSADPELYQTHLEVLMMLHDPLELEDFRAAVAPYLPEFWIVADLTDSYAGIAPSMEMLSQVANQMLVGVTLASILTLSLLITLFLKDRRHEIGIYLAIGEKRIKIIMQIIFEVISIAVVGITLAVFVGNLIAGRLSHEMVLNEVNQPVQEPVDRWGFGRGPDEMGLAELGFAPELTPDELMAAFDTTLSANTVMLIYGAAVAIVMLSTLIPVVYVVRLQPKKVLL